MNPKDLQIISHLRRDARVSLTKLSKSTQIPVSTIYDRIKSNEQQYIKKHTALIRFDKLGYNVRANFSIRVDPKEKEDLKEHLMRHRSVNSLYRVSGEHDFMVECIFKEMRDSEDFIQSLVERFTIRDYKSFFIVEDVKRESFLADPELADLHLGKEGH